LDYDFRIRYRSLDRFVSRHFVLLRPLLYSNFQGRVVSLILAQRAVSSGLPLTRGIAASRALIAGAGPGEALPLLLGEVGIGIVYFVLGYVVFCQLEIVAKRLGTLELF